MNYLTKSLFVTGICCPVLLWYSVHNKEALQPPDPSAQRRMRLGTEAGILARDRYPNGELVEGSTEEATRKTSELLETDNPIYEATITFQKLLCKVDVLLQTDKGVRIIEVKSSTQLKEEYLYDIAFQTYVLRKAGINVESSHLLHINSEYTRNGDISLQELFTEVNVSEEIKPILEEIEQHIETMFKVLEGPCPEVKPGKHCGDSKCPLALVENAKLPENNVTQLYRNNGNKFLEKRIIKIVDIEDGIGLNKKQLIQYQATKENKVHVDKKHLQKWLDSLQYPIIHLDFETIDFAVPVWENTKPYLHVPFQYSIHIQQEDGTIEHREYLHQGSDDPRYELLQHMKANIPELGTVLAHYATFEKGRLIELGQAYPEYQQWIDQILQRLDDLIIPFQNFWYYDPKQHGSCSIKDVLPALVGTTYKGMAVANGTEAQIAYEKLMSSSENTKQLVKDLLLYCEQDTRAMVDVLKVLIDKSRA